MDIKITLTKYAGYHLRDNLSTMLQVIYFTISFFVLNIDYKDTLFLMSTTSSSWVLCFFLVWGIGNADFADSTEKRRIYLERKGYLPLYE